MTTKSARSKTKEARMIKDLLPRYYEAHNDGVTYTIISSTMVRNHEVAWMEYRGTVLCGPEKGKPFVGRELHCECYFTEGIGWKIDPKNRPVSLMDAEKCDRRKVAVRKRHKELRQEYRRLFNNSPSLFPYIPEIILDLIKKAKAGEFLEDGSGANFYCGYFYLETVADIVDAPMRNIWA
ncbi:MAG: hypothetical protein AAB965_00180, partial [Patescibacteria group bacterium]